MPTVSNKTQKPLSIPLPGGKTLHLSPGKTGQITARAMENARLKTLVEAGEIEIVSDDARPTGAAGGDKRGRASFYGPTSSSGIRRSGDR
jgi:hypothetical protein